MAFFIDLFIELLLLISIGGGLLLGFKVHPAFFAAPVVALVVFLLYLQFEKKKKSRLYKLQIEKGWGSASNDKIAQGAVEKLYKSGLTDCLEAFHIDDITWRDLNMDQVFKKLDHTMSLPGAQYLYNLLRHPSFDGDILKKRKALASQLRENVKIAQAIQYSLLMLGKTAGVEMTDFLHGGMKAHKNLLPLYRALSLSIFVVLGIFAVAPQWGLFALIASLAFNAYIYNNNKKLIAMELSVFKYLGGLISCAASLSKLDTGAIDLGQEKLKALVKKVRSIQKNVSKLGGGENIKSDMEMFMDYINIILLREPIIFYKTIKLIKGHIAELRELYLLVGEIDSYTAMASYESSLAYHCEPILHKASDSFGIKVESIYHPLLSDPVPNDFELADYGALITGSNASGKSTFLRTIGVNAILAQTLYITLAKSYSSNYFRVLTSIGTTDNIIEGDSYFMAEAKSIKRILDALEGDSSVLCILDEIFRGTNTAERISAATKVLHYMVAKHCCVLAATHDLELTKLVEDSFVNYHFEEEVEENDIRFDYLLHSGPCSSRNAIAILRFLGYPEEVYESAMELAQYYIKEYSINHS